MCSSTFQNSSILNRKFFIITYSNINLSYFRNVIIRNGLAMCGAELSEYIFVEFIHQFAGTSTNVPKDNYGKNVITHRWCPCACSTCAMFKWYPNKGIGRGWSQNWPTRSFNVLWFFCVKVYQKLCKRYTIYYSLKCKRRNKNGIHSSI